MLELIGLATLVGLVGSVALAELARARERGSVAAVHREVASRPRGRAGGPGTPPA